LRPPPSPLLLPTSAAPPRGMEPQRARAAAPPGFGGRPLPQPLPQPLHGSGALPPSAAPPTNLGGYGHAAAPSPMTRMLHESQGARACASRGVRRRATNADAHLAHAAPLPPPQQQQPHAPQQPQMHAPPGGGYGYPSAPGLWGLPSYGGGGAPHNHHGGQMHAPQYAPPPHAGFAPHLGMPGQHPGAQRCGRCATRSKRACAHRS
jgi:hypothetical protein